MQGNERKLLHGLLEYVAQQASQPDITSLTIPTSAISPETILELPGVVAAASGGDEDIWLQVQRLQPTRPPAIQLSELSRYIHISNLPDEEPTINKKQIYTDVSLLFSEDIAPEACEEKFYEVNSSVEAEFEQYYQLWCVWSDKEKKLRKSIQLYDQIFSWKTALAGTSSEPQELVAGIGLIGWILPDTKHKYVYPIISIPLEIVSVANGALQIRPRDTAPRIEMDAFLAQSSLGQVGSLRLEAKALLNDGRKISPFTHETYSDVVALISHNIDSRSVVSMDDLPSAGENPVLTYSWRFFIKRRDSSILCDDIEKLQMELANGAEIPEQPLSLVSPPSEQTRNHESVAFRGRGGIEGYGKDIQELYFPLPYNKEQITIIEQLTKHPGVVVQGPPGTGKTHTIANIICHYLAEGKRVLVTAEKAHALQTVQEKIPSGVRPLVVSRVGSDQDGRRELQNSIDAILQNLTQLKPAIVEEEITRAKNQINLAQGEMASIDRKVNEIARAHYSDIVIDDIAQRPNKMADLVVRGHEQYRWFDDVLSLDEKNAAPLTQDDVISLRTARRKVGEDLVYLYATIPDHAQLPSVQKLTDLHEALGRMRHFEYAEKSGKLWALKLNTDAAVDLIRTLLPRVKSALTVRSLFEEESKSSSWMTQLYQRVTDSRYKSEVDAFENMFPDLKALISERAIFIANPVSIPNEALKDPKGIEAIQRAEETGEPFIRFWFTKKELKDAVLAITVSGHYPSTIDEWKWVGKYLKLRARAQSVFARWTSLADLLGVPLLSLGDMEVTAALKKLELLSLSVDTVYDIARNIDGSFDADVDALFAIGRPSLTFRNVDELLELENQLNSQLAKIEISYTKLELLKFQEELANCDGDISKRMRDFSLSLGDDTAVQDVANTYLSYLNRLRDLVGKMDSFQIIADATEKLEQAGASKLANRVSHSAVLDSDYDEILPVDWRDAWNWSRIKSYLDSISDRTVLVDLAFKRKEIEKALARLYEQVSTQQAWLSLKKSASDKVITALNRYKTAIQKIGKGTGKGAVQYRKDAQNAMQDAAEAIPCWVMTHLQVSETVPAKLGLFDLIIVDEASQSTIDVLPVLMRGAKLLVVGDDKQVSPITVGLSIDRIAQLRYKYLAGQPHASTLTPNMSLYDLASSVYASNVMLLEHFRCHPIIIGYSNNTYYDRKIRPLRISKASEKIDPPLVSIYTPEGIRTKHRSANLNKIEAEAIVAEIANLLADDQFAGKTLGVVSLLGPAQAEYIQKLAYDQLDLMELSRRDFACGEASSFQGAERDIIFLSMVATPEECTALSGVQYEQRFNVAASRARERMYLVHSVTRDHLSPKDLRLGLLSYFSNPSAINISSLEDALNQCESGFEKDVLTELYQRGYQVIPQVPAGGYRLDMVVEGDGDARLAIECDGDAFHGPEQWPADMARQRALERAGWTFWRCFASTWTISREETLQDLIDTLTRMGIEPLQRRSTASSQVDFRTWSPPIREDVEIDDEELEIIS